MPVKLHSNFDDTFEEYRVLSTCLALVAGIKFYCFLVVILLKRAIKMLLLQDEKSRIRFKLK